MAIVRIDFKCTIKSGKTKQVLEDYIRVVLPDPGRAEEIFIEWANRNVAIRGDSGIFYPSDRALGTCVFKKSSVVE